MVKRLQSSVFVCQQCGNEFPKWLGQCSACKAWNSLVEVPASRSSKGRGAGSKGSGGQRQEPLRVSEVESHEMKRFSTGMEELDRVFGHSVKDSHATTGIVPGSVGLLTGEPGMGKSTLLTQLTLNLSKQKQGVLYVNGEESPEQVKLRLNRLGEGGDSSRNSKIQKSETRNSQLETIYLLPETVVENVVEEILQSRTDKGNKYKLVIIDSIQSMTSEALASFAGSVGQVRECGLQLTQALKSAGVAGILVGHVTKEGTIAGPKTLEHMVDAVFHLEGETAYDLRMIRALKNRFGTTDEVGVFRMTGGGLEEIVNPAEAFLHERLVGEPGSVVTAVLEGSRVMLFEIQALVLRSTLAMPRRVVNGVRLSRLQMILAVLQKKLNISLGEMDVFVNVAGGATIVDPGADLAIALAILSSVKNVALPKDAVVFGELGLLGEIRRVMGHEKRMDTARKVGYNKVIGMEERTIREVRI